MAYGMHMELLERELFLAELRGLLDQASDGDGWLAMLGGEAGVGKTSLTRQLAHEVDSSARVLVGACDALSTPRPLGPIEDIASSASENLAQLLRGNARRDEIFRAVLTELSLGPEPTLLIIEDVHWADEATLDLMRFLGRRIGGTRSLVLATYREDEVGSTHPLRIVLGDLATASNVRRMSLPPLSERAVRTLVGVRDLDVGALYNRTGGNPFYVTEVLATEVNGIPPTVRDAVLTRAARLSEPARRALAAAAVMGSPMEPRILPEVADVDTVAIEECLASGMLRADGESLAFRHELAREAILATISPPRRRELHSLVLARLRALPQSDKDVAVLAHHADAAGDRDAVLEYAPAAARDAAALRANREAAAQYVRALRFAKGLPDEQRLALLEAYAEVSDLSGQGAPGIGPRNEMIVLARAIGDRAKEAEHLSWLALSLSTAWRTTDAERAMEEALAILADIPEGLAHARVYSILAELRMMHRDLVPAVAWGERAVDLAERFGDDLTLAQALNSLGGARLVGDDVERGRADLERCLDIARQVGDEGLEAGALADLGSGLSEVYRFAEADRYLCAAITYANEHDLGLLDFWRHWAVAWLALTRLFQGRWDDAAEHAVFVLRFGTEAADTSETPAPGVVPTSFQNPSYVKIPALIGLGRIRARRGDPQVAPILNEALALSPPSGPFQFLGSLRAARAEAAWLIGDRHQTAVEARAAYDVVVRQGLRWQAGELAYWLWRAGELTEPPATVAEPFALQIRGDWAGAAAAWDVLSCPYEAARARAESSDETALRLAWATFDGLGARPELAAVTQRLRELGARHLPRGPRKSTRANASHLTAREMEVLFLIEEGRSNAEAAKQLYLSPKTIEHHVSSILAKLSVSSRQGALAEARARGLLPQS